MSAVVSEYSYFLLDANEAIERSILPRGDFKRLLHRYIELGDGKPAEKYDLLERLGKGAQGSVHLARNKTTGAKVAVKIIGMDWFLTSSERKAICSELVHLQNNHHENLVSFHECYVQGDELWIVMDYAEGLPLNKLKKYSNLTEPETATLVREILQALQNLHTRDVIHCDIKPGNILLTTDGTIKIVDFGLATRVADSNKGHAGTLDYMAPEIVNEQDYNQKADIWSLGITLFSLIFNGTPHKEYDSEDMPKFNSQYGKLSYEETIASPILKDFLDCCLAIDPTDRSTASTLLEHPYLKDTAPQEVMAQTCCIARDILKDTKEIEDKDETPTSSFTSMDIPDLINRLDFSSL